MDSEKIFFVLLILGAGAFVIWETKRQKPAPAIVTQDTDAKVIPPQPADISGPAYVTYNTPYAFAPPVGNILPPLTKRASGVVVTGGYCDDA